MAISLRSTTVECIHCQGESSLEYGNQQILTAAWKICKHLLRNELQYDELLSEIEPTPHFDGSSESAATLFFHNIGTKVIQGYLEPSLSMVPIRVLLSGHLDKRREGIVNLTRSVKECSNGESDNLPLAHFQEDTPYKPWDQEQQLRTKDELFHQSYSHLAIEQICEDHKYTSALKEMGDSECSSPDYSLIRLGFDPPRWCAVAQYRGVKSSAEASSKRAAKHSASKSLWLQMGGEPIA